MKATLFAPLDRVNCAYLGWCAGLGYGLGWTELAVLVAFGFATITVGRLFGWAAGTFVLGLQRRGGK